MRHRCLHLEGINISHRFTAQISVWVYYLVGLNMRTGITMWIHYALTDHGSLEHSPNPTTKIRMRVDYFVDK